MSRTDRNASNARGSQATTDEGTATATEATTATAKRAPRPKINVGEVVVGAPVEGADFRTRATPMDSNPVAQAVKAAELGKAYPLHVDADKVDGVLSILRRAGSRYGVRMNIGSAPYAPSDQAEGKVVVLFRTEAKKASRNGSEDKAEATPSAE